MTLPVALAGHDIIGQAKTGTGKTLGFGIPLLQRVVAPEDAGLRRRWPSPASRRRSSSSPPASSPSRSPATSSDAGKKRSVRVLTVYGGRAYEPQVEALQKRRRGRRRHPRPAASTSPSRSTSTCGHATIVVLDEADEMLDLGFLPDVERLLVADARRPPDDAVLGHHARRRSSPWPAAT